MMQDKSSNELIYLIMMQDKSSVELVECQSVSEVQLDGAERKLVSWQSCGHNHKPCT